ncbi:hypothetical protein F5B22DRAFT_660390 [Xylaria bambusicola]|uniref:uncharacterized protein n=1 Tax=Xylaria bambusicola TaxID=326684 RepID=UPI00200742E5|nr:uncharacterized protein F5B22DRAFT_660390 [Xylaria bambusicola]KAI0506306.1 hypothetical protein F5B22DRAFT_660390 [Xylaria bambusicola]
MAIRTILLPLLFTQLAASFPSSHPLLQVKRTFPTFEDENDFQPGQEDQIKAALPDAIDLVARLTENYDQYSDIWAKYFPVADHDTVKKVFQQIVSDPTNPGEGEDRLKDCRVAGFDFLPVTSGEDACAEGATAYTSNFLESDHTYKGVSRTHFCPPAYQQKARYSDISCNDIGDTLNTKMDFLGATILHEWLHNDAVGKAVTGTHIIDVDGQNGYGPYNTRRLLRDSPDQCKNNADSYTWLALEVFWTKLCLRNTPYNDPPAPDAPSCEHAADPSGSAGYCSRFAVEGWCDCGSAGDYQQLDGSDPCGYTAGPQFAPIDLDTDHCGILPSAPTTSECTDYNTPVADAENMNNQLNDWGDGTLCCTNGDGGCANIAVSGDSAVDLCSASTTQQQCVGCARMANYLSGIISSCQQDGKVGGKQDIAENPGLSIQI